MFPVIYREMAVHGRMTIDELSKHLGISAQSLSYKLNGKSQFKLNEMMKIQELLGKIPLDELFRTE